jgi:hypothetical protein
MTSRDRIRAWQNWYDQDDGSLTSDELTILAARTASD